MPSTKRQNDSVGEGSPSKKLKSGRENKTAPKIYDRIASLDNATAANKNPPVAQLQNALKSVKTPDTVNPGACVVYWMRMEDLRSTSLSFTRFTLLPNLISHPLSQRQPRHLSSVQIRKVQQYPSYCALRVQSAGLQSPQ
jgi:hypothetical protein